MIEFPGVANPAREGPQPQTTARGQLFEPRTGSGPGVLVLHAWWGLNETVLDFARNLGQEGFTVFAPDLFDDGKPPATTIEDAEQRSSAVEADGGVMAEQRALGAADWLVAHTGGAIGAVGFSFGAGYALWLGKRRPEAVRAIVVYYGTGGPIDGQAPVMGHFAADDPYETEENVADLEEQLRAAGRRGVIHRDPDTKHWFAERDRPEFVPGAADLAWQRTVEFLRAELTGG